MDDKCTELVQKQKDVINTVQVKTEESSKQSMLGPLYIILSMFCLTGSLTVTKYVSQLNP